MTNTVAIVLLCLAALNFIVFGFALCQIDEQSAANGERLAVLFPALIAIVCMILGTWMLP